VLLAGTLTFVIAALFSNLSRSLGHPSPRFVGWLGFAALLFSFAYAALQAVLVRERDGRAFRGLQTGAGPA
jgi:hypothetical protein